MHFLNSLQKKYNLSREAQTYIKKDQFIYKKVLKEAQKRENDRLVKMASNKRKKIWQIINKQVGKCSIPDRETELMTATSIESNPQKVAELLNANFVETVDEINKQNMYSPHTTAAQTKTECCPNSTALMPITEQEVVYVIRRLKGKFSVAYVEIPEYVVKQCAVSIKGPLTHIYNMSISSGTFPELFKVARVKPLYKKGDIYSMQNCRPISILPVF